MKIIDLINKIANGEEVPKKIKWYDRWFGKELDFIFDERQKDYKEYGNSNYLFNNEFMTESLNDKVEIIEEENKIPEKLKIEQDGQTYNNFYIVNQNETKCYLTKHSKMIVETLNKVIDYLKEKENK